VAQTTHIDDAHTLARQVEDALFDQAKFMESLPATDPRRASLQATREASHRSLNRQIAMEKAQGGPNWVAAKSAAIAHNKLGRELIGQNNKAGVGGWTASGAVDAAEHRQILQAAGLM
jgi:hypothetical protein